MKLCDLDEIKIQVKKQYEDCNIWMDDDDFRSHGERKDGGENG